MHKYKLLIFLLLLSFTIYSFSQDNRSTIESLFEKIELSDENGKIGLLNNLSMAYWNFSLDSSLYFANEALSLAHIMNDKKGLSDAYSRIGYVYFYKNENERAIDFYQKSLDLLIELDDSKGISNIYRNFGFIYTSKNEYELAIQYFTKALEESKKRNDLSDIASFYSSLANTYYEISNNEIKVSVKDTGKGISKEDLEKLFKMDKNYTTKGTENESGIGLGLILCKELITHSNGELFVESVLGKGSNFQFVLPLQGDAI